jgi:DNA-binding Xre family transcriptional regulator
MSKSEKQRAAPPEFGTELAIIPDRNGQPVSVIVPIAAWDMLPGDLRDRLASVDTAVRGEERLFVLLPWKTYEPIHEDIEDAIDALAFDEAKVQHARDTAARARAGAAETIPLEVVQMEAEGLPPIMAWRKHRQMRQADLAAAAGVERSYIAHLEARKRQGTPDVLARIARALGCLVEDLVETEVS